MTQLATPAEPSTLLASPRVHIALGVDAARVLGTSNDLRDRNTLGQRNVHRGGVIESVWALAPAKHISSMINSQSVVLTTRNLFELLALHQSARLASDIIIVLVTQGTLLGISPRKHRRGVKAKYLGRGQ